MKKYTTSIILIIIGIALITIGNKLQKPQVVEPSPIDLIMAEPTFQASMKIQAENIHLDRQKAIIEKRKEELRKEELNLASSTKQSLI